MKQNISKLKPIIMPITILSIIFAVCGYGFSVDYYVVDECKATVSRYVKANFERVTHSYDEHGNISTHVDSWSEFVSDVNTLTVVNELPQYPPMPDYDTSVKRHPDFYSFKKHTDAQLTVSVSFNDTKDEFTESVGKTGACITKLDSIIKVKTWYSIPYGSDF